MVDLTRTYNRKMIQKRHLGLKATRPHLRCEIDF
jgi:hypothetical protein